MPRPDPSPLLSARSIAVVGATERPGSYSDTIMRNLAATGFDGEVWGVNPGRSEVHGRGCFPSVLDLPEPVDVVAVAVPAAGVPEVISQSVERGCGGAVVVSAGFGEVESGRGFEEELTRIAIDASFPVCGPNGNGVISVSSGASIWGDSLPDLRPGNVAMISQSGNVAVNAIGSRRGIDFHTVISTGNQAVVDTGTWLASVAQLEGVHSVALFIEGDGDGARMAEALAECIDNDVRVAVLKVGGSEAGSKAAAAHTGAIAGDQRVFRALVEEAGAAWATDPHELLELARVLAVRKARARRDRGPGSGPAILTCSGGDSGIAADIAETIGLDLPELAPATIDRLGELLPEAATPGNPLDYTSLLWTETELLTEIIATVGSDPGVDQLLLFHDHPRDLRPEHEAEWGDVRRALAAGATASDSPAIFASTLPDLIDEAAMVELAGIGIPVVGGMAAALSAIRAGRLSIPPPERLVSIAYVAAAATKTGGEWLGEGQTKDLLRGGGAQVPNGRVVDDAAGAVKAAGMISWPVAIKLTGPAIRHKSDNGAIALDLENEIDLTREADRLLELPIATGASLLVEEMLDHGLELIISAGTDSAVPFLTIGLGGIWTELLDDVAVIPLPANAGRVKDALLGLKAAPLLTGARGSEPIDLETVADLAVRVGELLIEEGLSLIELNPVIAGPTGAIAADAIAAR
jgi:acyl-CoA synthetase (NDP forming)